MRTCLKTTAATLALCAGLSLPTSGAHAQSVVQSLFSRIIGGNDEAPAINYSERAPLVIPGQRAMRAPEDATALAEDPAWPKDPDEKKRRRKKMASVESRGPASSNTELLSQEELATGSLNGPSGFRGTNSQRENEYNKMSNPVSPLKLRRKGTFGASSAPLVPGVEPPRTNLIDPPTGMRVPLATASLDPDTPLPSEVSAEENKSWVRKIWDFQK